MLNVVTDVPFLWIAGNGRSAYRQEPLCSIPPRNLYVHEKCTRAIVPVLWVICVLCILCGVWYFEFLLKLRKLEQRDTVILEMVYQFSVADCAYKKITDEQRLYE